MKLFLKKLFVFTIMIVFADICFGIIFKYFTLNAKGGDTKRNNYICNEVTADALIFGSSHAIHHYNPVIIKDSLLLSCYNCGQDGNGIILNYGRYQLIRQRCSPKVIIYDIMPDFDYYMDDNHKYLGWLKSYYDRPGISDIFIIVDKSEKYKMVSNMYRYNSRFLTTIMDFYHPIIEDDIYGFRPVRKSFDSRLVNNQLETKKLLIDSLKIKYLRSFIESSKDINLIFVSSPSWIQTDTRTLDPIRNICEEYHIPFLDYSNHKEFLYNNELFYDRSHLNSKGADLFTKIVVRDIKDCF